MEAGSSSLHVRNVRWSTLRLGCPIVFSKTTAAATARPAAPELAVEKNCSRARPKLPEKDRRLSFAIRLAWTARRNFAADAGAKAVGPAVRSVHPSAAGVRVSNRYLLGLGGWPDLRDRYLDGRNSLARRRRNNHVRYLTPVEAAPANGALLMHAGICTRIAAKAAAISDDRPDERIATTPDPFGLVDQHAAHDLWRVAEKFGHGVRHFGILQNAELRESSHQGRSYRKHHLRNSSLTYRKGTHCTRLHERIKRAIAQVGAAHHPLRLRHRHQLCVAGYVDVPLGAVDCLRDDDLSVADERGEWKLPVRTGGLG